MSDTARNDRRADIFVKTLIALAIAGGILVRLLVYLQNRNLIIDEANVVRNLFERGFAELTRPLSYEQYAPPVFLWIGKLNTIVFGFGEYAVRLYPLLAGIAAIFVMNALLKQLMPAKSLWFPLILFVSTHILIRYSSEVKQYMPDVFITLMLLLLALRIDIRKYFLPKFAVAWFLIGSLAIWSSMPSVFILAGIGCYYGGICLRDKNYKQLSFVAATAILWMAQFGFYYLAILKPQANSTYLQNFHQNDFLFATPGNGGEWMHNWIIFSALLKQMGKWPMMLIAFTLFLITGIVKLIRTDVAKALLFIVPVAVLLVAAALNQYSLMPRVALFSIPLLIILIGIGFDAALRIDVREWRWAMAVVGLYCIGGNLARSIEMPYKYEELTDGLRFVSSKGIAANRVYIYHSSVPAFIYYTEIHPQKQRWTALSNGALKLSWDTQYKLLSWEMKYVWRNTKPVAFVFTNATRQLADMRASEMHYFMPEIARYERDAVRVFVYQKMPKG